MKKTTILFLGVLLLLSSCAPSITDDNDNNEVVENDENEESKQETSLVPSDKLSESNYQTPVPYKTSAARGIITKQVANRLDIDEMEEGLRDHSKSVFDPDDYLFEEGQYLDEDTVYDWLEKGPEIEEILSEDEADKISEEDEDSLFMSHILEQNFLERDDDKTELAGVSIGLALKSVYQKDDGSVKTIPKKDVQEEGEEIAEKILERARKVDGLEDVPIMIGLYSEESENSPVSGNYIAKADVDDGDMSIKDWDDIDEEHVLFPSDDAEDDHFEEYQVIEDFGDEIKDYFPNYVGVIGKGFYTDDELEKLNLEIPLDFNGKGEIIAFTQYVNGLIKDMFPVGYNLEVEITSSDELESIIYQEPDEEEPTVHIFD